MLFARGNMSAHGPQRKWTHSQPNVCFLGIAEKYDQKLPSSGPRRPGDGFDETACMAGSSSPLGSTILIFVSRDFSIDGPRCYDIIGGSAIASEIQPAAASSNSLRTCASVRPVRAGT